MEVNVEIVLSYNDEETDWKVKKNISRFIYRLKKYRTGNRFSHSRHSLILRYRAVCV